MGGLSVAGRPDDTQAALAHSGLMTRVLTSRRLRWATPAVVAAGVAVAAVTTTASAGASAAPKLPARSAAALLAAVEQVHPAGLSGTIVETANLGLPSLPATDTGGAGDLSWQSLLTGSHTMRVWYAGPTQQRIAVLAPMSERDIVHNGSDLWTYTSTTNTVTHATLRAGGNRHSDRAEAPGPTPQQAAEQALRAIDPSTRVTVDRTARVAGRAAYQLDLAPRDSRSLIGSVRIAIDAATSTPLRVQVFAARAAAPAIQVGFTDISFATPSSSVFHFVPPAGSRVTQRQLGADQAGGSAHPAHQISPHAGSTPDAHRPTTLGSGWTQVVELPAGGQLTGRNGQLLARLSTAVPSGRLITTALVSVLITNDGRIFAGPVGGSALQHVVATGHGL